MSADTSKFFKSVGGVPIAQAHAGRPRRRQPAEPTAQDRTKSVKKFRSSIRTAAIALAGGIMLSGCGALPSPSITPDAMPSPADVTLHFREFDDAWRRLGELNPGDSESDLAAKFVSFGYDVSNARCTAFFNKVGGAQSQGNFAKTLSTSIGTGAGLVTALSGGTLGVLAGLFGATGIVPGIIDSYGKEFLLSELGDDLATKILSAMNDYRRNPPEKATKINAIQMVRSHASICTVPAMKAMVKAAVNGTELKVVPNSGTGEATPRAAVTVRSSATQPAPARPLMSVGSYQLVPK